MGVSFCNLWSISQPLLLSTNFCCKLICHHFTVFRITGWSDINMIQSRILHRPQGQLQPKYFRAKSCEWATKNIDLEKKKKWWKAFENIHMTPMTWVVHSQVYEAIWWVWCNVLFWGDRILCSLAIPCQQVGGRSLDSSTWSISSEHPTPECTNRSQGQQERSQEPAVIKNQHESAVLTWDPFLSCEDCCNML